MQKMMVVNYEKCTGCRLCELVCSVKHEGVSNPSRARIHITKWEMEGIMMPMVCNQCEPAPCVIVCPTNARSLDKELGRVTVDYNRCIKCKTCVVACPFGAVGFDYVSGKIISCDLCDGDPVCARFCETEALQYVDASDINKKRQREAAEKLCESMRRKGIIVRVIIIGNGVAGNTAGNTIRFLDSQADITIISEETFPEYSACALPHYLAGELKRQKLFLRTKRDYARDRIKTIFGEKVISINPEEKKIFLDTRNLVYDKLVLATGSKPMILPIKGVNLNGVFALKSFSDAERILNYPGETAVIIGSGLIGVETGVALSKRGLRIYLVEMLDRLMPRVFDKRPASLLRDILEEQGIKVLTGEIVTSIIGNGKVEGVVTDRQHIECDMVILSTGMIPNIELAQGSGLNIGPLGGISVTQQMMTSSGDIYAGGDCVETEDMFTGNNTLSLFWHNAKRQGEVIGYNCCRIFKSYLGSVNLTSLDIFGLHITSFGSTEAEVSGYEDIEVIERSIDSKYYRLIISKGRLLGVQSIGDIKDMGALLCVLLGRNNLNEIKQVIDKKTLPVNPLYYRAARCLGSDIRCF